MSGKIEISRKLGEKLADLLHGHGVEDTDAANELRALLAAPVVERQPVAQVRNDIERSSCIWFGPIPPHGTNLYTSPPAPVAVPRCDVCSTHEVSLHRCCHNSDCERYADEITVYEGWNAPLPAPVAVVNERYEFEKYYDPEALERDSDEYVRMAVQMAWEGWHRRACLDKVKELNQ